ncbi:UDP-4-amino-4,6-dideoxy-N-acetyl-beta-L-altrosamine transaminase [Kordiimonas pumila]|uniref:UDP-4-amino-4, 6-dideoxy-N-acetyl-beta-L-altrosamine transaminase n=1 Tax=Kordiimonas pumila TaxID=2161677 RepID=A0ABV7D346_9PROT|nr:UDP-4-amino-4,6-dideoxy-N-acetyl-beta-L-altrosamine transaminase [Kordiimonas pumila]
MPQHFLPYGRHTLDSDDIAAVVDVLKHGALTCGPKVDEFEAEFARKIGAVEAVVVSNGTTALHLALLAANFRPGDIAIVPTLTFLSTANAVHMAGGRVVFADVCPKTGLMTPDTLKAAFKKSNYKAKAVLPVHLTGQSEHMAEIHDYARDKGMVIISDCCHAIGASYKAGGSPGDGQFEDFGCYSLHPVKSIAMGEGGVVTTKTPELARYIRQLRSHDMRRLPEEFVRPELGFDDSGEPNPWYYEMHELGYNYRATDIQCALGLSQLGKLDKFLARRLKLADMYDTLLEPLAPVVTSNPRSIDCNSAWHLYAVKIDFASMGKSRGHIMRSFAEKGVGTQVHYIPVHEQPYYQKHYGVQDLPGAADYYAGTLTLPLFPSMFDTDPGFVVKTLKAVLNN